MAKTIFITGASRGFGKIWAEALLKRGDKVVATARDLNSLNDLVNQYGDSILPLQLDVNDRDADCWEPLLAIADAAGSEWVELLIGKIQEVHFDPRRVGVHRDDVIGQVTIERRARLRVVMGMLEKSHANSHHDRPLDLVAASQRI